jgi:hypothetical protein
MRVRGPRGPRDAYAQEPARQGGAARLEHELYAGIRVSRFSSGALPETVPVAGVRYALEHSPVCERSVTDPPSVTAKRSSSGS